MKRSWKHKVIPALLAGTLTLSIGTAVYADNDKGNGKGNGKDDVKVEDKKDKKDKKDNKPVTKLEAVDMVMEMLEDELDLKAEGDSSLDKKIPEWARNSVELALEYNIVSWEDIKDYDKKASRLFVTKLLVEATGTDIDEVEADDLSFTDIKKLSKEEKAYLTYALEEDLIDEYEDEKTFKPNKAVTYSEMEEFVDTLEIKVEDEDIDFEKGKKGTIERLYTGEDQIKIGSATYDVSHNVSVQINDKKADYDDLKVGMKVRFDLEDGEVEKIWAYTKDGLNKVDFKIDKISDGNADGDFKEAVKTGKRISDSTPDLRNENLYIIWNGSNQKKIDLSDINGTQDDGFETADELEDAINNAINRAKQSVNVTFKRSSNLFVFETTNSPTNAAPSIQFVGDADTLKALGLDETVTVGSLNGKESWKISVESDAEADRTYKLAIEINDKTKEEVKFLVDEEDSAEEIAVKIRDAVNRNSILRAEFDISIDGAEITLTADRAKDIKVEIEIK